jgi:hypothetical protein
LNAAVRGVEVGTGGHSSVAAGQQSRRGLVGDVEGQRVEAGGQVDRAGVDERELCDLAGVECVEELPLVAAMALVDSAATFVVADLLEPEAPYRRVEQSEQPQVLVLAGPGGQFDHRRRLLEDFASAVENEVVVGGDFGERNTKR